MCFLLILVNVLYFWKGGWACCYAHFAIIPDFFSISRIVIFYPQEKKSCILKNFFYVAAPDLGSDDVYGVWKIDDTDHSFSSQPFRIRYARQDVCLSLMVSFNLPHDKSKVPLTPYLLR